MFTCPSQKVKLAKNPKDHVIYGYSAVYHDKKKFVLCFMSIILRILCNTDIVRYKKTNNLLSFVLCPAESFSVVSGRFVIGRRGGR